MITKCFSACDSARLFFALLLGVIVSCRPPMAATTSSTGLAYRSCRVPHKAVDSAFIVDQARAVLNVGSDFGPSDFQPVRLKGLEVGVLVSLTAPRLGVGPGSGGLAWVDVETGCPIALKLYE